MKKELVYLDNAASTAVLPEVIDCIAEVLREGTGNPSSTHSYGRSARSLIEQSRKTIADAIGASPSEIIFTSGGTEANNMVLKTLVEAHTVKHIISSPIEHSCVANTLKHLEKNTNVEVHLLPVDDKGRVDIQQLESLLPGLEGTVLVSLMHANNEIGTLTNIERVGALCDQYEALFHSDTVQTIGHMPFDVKKAGVHYCSASAHKFHGPKGVGFLFMRSDSKLPPFIHGGGQERSYRSGTEDLAGICGMAKALEIAQKNMKEDNDHIDQLKDYAINKLKSNIEGVKFNGDIDYSLNRVLSICLPPAFNNDMLLFQLDLGGVCVSAGSACASGAAKQSGVLSAIGHPEDHKTIRISFAGTTQRSDIDKLVDVLVEISSKVVA